MKTYLAYKNQIQGFRDVSETVKTVEKIAASSIHLLKERKAKLDFYTDRIENILARLGLFYEQRDHPLLRRHGSGKKIVIVLTGDKGLAGNLWHRVVNLFLEKSKEYNSVIVFGVKGEDYLKEENVRVLRPHLMKKNKPNTTEFKPSFFQVETKKAEQSSAIKKKQKKSKLFYIYQKYRTDQLTAYLFEKFKQGAFSKVDILYPKFVSLVKQQAVFIPFLPFQFMIQRSYEQSGKSIGKEPLGLPIFEPSKKEIFIRLLEKYIRVFFHKIILETKLSEFSARTIAMEDAAVKTDELIQKITLNYFKERKRIITQKQLESFTVHKIV